MSYLSGFDTGIAPAVGALTGGAGGQTAKTAAPAQGISSDQMDDVLAQMRTANAQNDANNPELQAALHPMSDPSHPVWDVLGAAAGTGAPAQPAPGGMPGYEHGGLVRRNHGSPTRGIPQMNGKPAPGEARPAVDANSVDDAPMLAMSKGGLVPEMAAGRGRSMGQGITPGNTEGQPGFEAGGPVQGYADGGAVDSGIPASGYNFMPVPGQAAPAVSGRAAGLSLGLPAGMAMGHNLVEAYRQRQERNAAANVEDTQAQADENAYRKSHGMAPIEESDGSMLGAVRSHLNNFFNMLHGHTHDQEGNLVDNSSASTGAMPTSPTGVANPAQSASPVPAAGSPPAAPGAAPAAAAPPGVGAAPTAAPPGAAPPAGGAPRPAGAPASPLAAAAAPVAAQSGGPTQATATTREVGKAEQQLASDARSGVPPTAAGSQKRISLDDEDWHRMEQAKFRAAKAAAAAGMDPTKVYQALTAQQTAHFQGQYIYQLGKAQQALQAGDYDSMKQFLRNANYYLPNGQDIEFKTAGQLTGDDATTLNKIAPNTASNTPVLANPFYGLPGHEGDSKYVPLNPMSLHAFATAALDPRGFAAGQMDLYKAGLEFKTNMMKAQAAQTLATGRYKQGVAAEANAQVNVFMGPYKAALDKAHADAYEAAANKALNGNKGGGTKISAASVLANQKAGASAFDNASQGELESVPGMVPSGKTGPDGKPVMVPNLSPGAAKQVRNPSKVSPMFADLTPAERQSGRQMAQQIAGSNVGTIGPEESAQLSAAIIRDQRIANAHGGTGGTHVNPDTGKPDKNVVYAPAKGPDGQEYPAVWVWSGGRYVHAWTTPNMSEDTGVTQTGIPSGGSGGNTGAGEQSTENDSADDDVLAAK